MIRSLIVLVGMNAVTLAFAAGWARAIAGRAPEFVRGSSRFLLLTLTIWLVTIQGLVLIVGLAGGLNCVTIVMASVVLLMSSLTCRPFRIALARLPLTFYRWAGPFAAPHLSFGIAAVVFLLLHQAVFTFRLPQSIGWDDAAYHAAYPSLWLQQGQIDFKPLNLKAYYPQATGLQSLWFVLPFMPGERSDAHVWVALTGLVFDVMFLIGCAVACRKMGLQPGAWTTAGALCLSSWFVLIRQLAFCADDVAVGSLLVAAVAFAAPERSGNRRRTAMVEVLACALLLGYAIATKPLTALPAAVIVLAVIWRLSRIFSRATTVKLTLVATAAALAVGGFWFVRNMILTGNPLYPAEVAGFPGATHFPGTRLVEFGRYFGSWRGLYLSLEAYLDFPFFWGLAAVVGLGYAALVALGIASGSRPMALLTVLSAGSMLAYLPWQPFGAGWAWNITSGVIHPLSQRYIFGVAFLGWLWVGVLGSGPLGSRRASFGLVVTALCVGGVMERGAIHWAGFMENQHLPVKRAVVIGGLLAIAVGATTYGPVALRWLFKPIAMHSTDRHGTRHAILFRSATFVTIGVGIVIGLNSAHRHRAKLNATGPDSLGVWAGLDNQPPSHVWGYAYTGFYELEQALGLRYQHHLLRVDYNGRASTEPEPEMDLTGQPPPAPTVDAATFVKNLRAAGIDLIITRSQKFGERVEKFPPQHALLQEAAGVTSVYSDGMYFVWRITPDEFAKR